MTYETKKNVPFFYKKQERKQRSECSFIKNGKERKDRNVLLKRTDAQPWNQPMAVQIPLIASVRNKGKEGSEWWVDGQERRQN